MEQLTEDHDHNLGRAGYWERRGSAKLEQIYARAAALDAGDRNPIIFIPGVLGSRLVVPETSQSIWGDFSQSADPNSVENRNLIALEMRKGTSLDHLKSPTQADGTMREARPRRLPISVGVYRDGMRLVGVGSRIAARSDDTDPGEIFASFEFGYDWRRSLDESACKLGQFMRLAAHFVQARRQNSDPVKFNIVAHSMGGLLVRYFLRYGAQLLPSGDAMPRLTWAGAEHVERVAVIGTPNAGSVPAIDGLVSGLAPKKLVHPGYDPGLVGTMPALYQLLPRSRHRPFRYGSGEAPDDLFDPEFWIAMGWGLADPGLEEQLAAQLAGIATPQDRRAVALDHLAKCLTTAKKFHAAIDMPAKRPKGLALHAVAGDSVPTISGVSAERGSKAVTATSYDAGDGTVLRSSVLLDERVGQEWTPRLKSPIRWSSITFANANHIGLTKDRAAMNNVLFNILEGQAGH